MKKLSETGITLRLERPEDHREVEELTREAFWGMHQPGCDEHLLVHQLRDAAGFVPELDYVAVADGRIVGSIFYTKSAVVAEHGESHELLTFGPLSVLPAYQQRGIGQLLVRHTLDEARRLGYRGVVITGHPGYYPRFGFERAASYGIHLEGQTFDALMVLALQPGGLQGVSGGVRFDPAFEMAPDALEAFDATFPPKAKREMPSLNIVLNRLAAPARRALAAAGIPSVVELSHKSRRELAALHGIGKNALKTIEETLEELGYPRG